MSDRTPGSVRTGTRGGDGAAPEAPRPDDAPAAAAPAAQPAPAAPAAPTKAPQAAAPVSATQSIPASGAMRAQQAAPAEAPPSRPVAPPAQPAGAPARPGGPAGRPAGAAAKIRGRAGRGPRRARLQLRHIDLWSAFKISLVLSIVLFFVWIIAVAILYVVLNSLGVFSTVNDLFGQLGSATGQASGSSQVVSAKVVFIGAAVIGAINVILMTALCTVATFIYNLCADLVGGLEVTLSERD